MGQVRATRLVALAHRVRCGVAEHATVVAMAASSWSASLISPGSPRSLRPPGDDLVEPGDQVPRHLVSVGLVEDLVTATFVDSFSHVQPSVAVELDQPSHAIGLVAADRVLAARHDERREVCWHSAHTLVAPQLLDASGEVEHEA